MFKPCVSSDTWPSKSVFQEIMNDVFRQFNAQQIYRVMKNTWDFQKSVLKREVSDYDVCVRYDFWCMCRVADLFAMCDFR